MVCLGCEPWVTKWKAKMNPLTYGTPPLIQAFQQVKMIQKPMLEASAHRIDGAAAAQCSAEHGAEARVLAGYDGLEVGVGVVIDIIVDNVAGAVNGAAIPGLKIRILTIVEDRRTRDFMG